MFKKPSKMLAPWLLGTALLWGGTQASQAQCGFLVTDGCSGTNYNNYGVYSSGAATLEYDNHVSTFHATVVRDFTGTFRIWGEAVAADGLSNVLSPIELNAANFPGLTGRVLKAGMGGSSTPGQVVVLTTDGLFVWGNPGALVDWSLTSGNAVQKLRVNGEENGLPPGVTPTQVKMMFVTNQTIAITTCNGHVYVLTANSNSVVRGDGGASANTWAHVREATDGNPFLTGVVAVRGNGYRLLALKSDGSVWGWGGAIYLGNGWASAARPRAEQLVLPPGEAGNAVKMIGASNSVQYLLYENGHLYAVGSNGQGQLGDFSTHDFTPRLTWVQPRYTVGGPPMNDILWMSPNEHFINNSNINVINSAYQVYNWGSNSGAMLGRGANNNNHDPGQPSGMNGTGKILSVETGGHTTMMVKACTQNFGYVGHRIDGSMGNGSSETFNELSITYATANVQICGATSVPQILVNGTATIDEQARYCNGTSVVLSTLQAGGTWSIVSGPATLTGNRLSFNGMGNDVVTVSYSSATPDCASPATATRTFTLGDCKTNSVSGTIWNDVNGNARQDVAEAGIDNGLWVNLVEPDGHVAGSAKVATDGTYSLALLTQNTQPGNYTLIITNSEKQAASPLFASDAPNADYGYTGTSVGGVANTGNRSGTIDIGALGGTVTSVDFGISNDPAVLPVKFGFVAAEILNNQLQVKWNTTSELNNSYFEIEASVDGINFTSIGKVSSRAVNGISTDALEYEFTKNASTGVLAAGLALLAIGAGLYRARCTRYAMMAVPLGIILLAAGCNKNRSDMLPEGKVYVRVVQVDKDGTKSYSKSVAVVKR